MVLSHGIRLSCHTAESLKTGQICPVYFYQNIVLMSDFKPQSVLGNRGFSVQ